MYEETQGINLAAGHKGKGESGDIVAVRSCVKSAKSLHCYIRNIDLQTKRNTHRKVFEDLLL